MSTVLAFKPLEDDVAAPEAKGAARVAPAPAAVAVSPAPTPGTPAGERLRDFAKAIIPPVFGIALMIGIWALVAIKSGSIPGPDKTWAAAKLLFADPFYQNGPNDQGIGWNVLSSLKRVGIGFGFAALVGIPMGFLLGRYAFMNSMF